MVPFAYSCLHSKKLIALSILPTPPQQTQTSFLHSFGFPKCNNWIYESLQGCAQVVGQAITEVLSFLRQAKLNLI